MRSLHLICALTIALLLAGLPASASDQALMVVANAKAGVTSLSRNELEEVFVMSRRVWPNGTRIVVLNLETGTPERTYFDNVVLGLNPDQVARYWIDRRTRGGGEAPMRLPNSSVVMKVIPALPGSIGYAPEGPLAPGVRRVARIQNGSVVAER
ncbi:MAG TPA: hypothetical protein VJR89_23885 [Polyangiales bacterium]|nr:hypothetical protein [Polyangiales bacterium]